MTSSPAILGGIFKPSWGISIMARRRRMKRVGGKLGAFFKSLAKGRG